MAEVKLYQGSKDNYDANEHHDGIYFATDEKEIWLNGLLYGHDLEWDKREEYTEYNAGDAVLYDSNTTKKLIVPIDEIKTYASSRFTPIGIIVIPTLHDVYGTGEAAMISLVNMNTYAPDTGSIDAEKTYWGQYKVDTDLTNFGTVVVTGTTASPTVEATSTLRYNDLASDDNSTSNPACPTDPSTHYPVNSTAYAGPSPYLEDGSRNPVYYQMVSSSSDNCLSDFDGVGNTNVLLNLATGQPNWKTESTITNNYNEGYSPAACCCWRYHTIGTELGDWYLPSIGELGYVLVRRGTINNTTDLLNDIYGEVSSYILNYDYYMSSSEYSSDQCRIITQNGVDHYNKNYVLICRAFYRIS